MSNNKVNTFSVRPSGIGYLLPNGRSGTITDPVALNTFYKRIYHNEINTKEEAGKKGRPFARRLTPGRGSQAEA
jgi:hypothetical protein